MTKETICIAALLTALPTRGLITCVCLTWGDLRKLLKWPQKQQSVTLGRDQCHSGAGKEHKPFSETALLQASLYLHCCHQVSSTAASRHTSLSRQCLSSGNEFFNGQGRVAAVYFSTLSWLLSFILHMLYHSEREKERDLTPTNIRLLHQSLDRDDYTNSKLGALRLRVAGLECHSTSRISECGQTQHCSTRVHTLKVMCQLLCFIFILAHIIQWL